MFKRLSALIRHPYFSTTLIFGVIILALVLIEARPSFPDPDSFYHAKMALMIRDHGFIHDFPWLQFTTFKDAYVDHHLLYHLLLIPFVTVFDPLVGMKVSAVFFGLLSFAAIWKWLKYLKAPFPEILTFLAALSTPFLNRMAYPRALSLSLVFFLLGTWALTERRRAWTFFVAFLFVWLYNGWPLLLLAFAAILAADVTSRMLASPGARLLESLRQTAAAYFPTGLALAGGLAAGLILNPYFPDNIQFAFLHIFKIGLVNYGDILEVGTEWFPFTPTQFVMSTLYLSLVFLVSVLLFIPRVIYKPVAPLREQLVPFIACLFLCGGFFFLTLKSQRYLEYAAPFLTLATGALLVYVWPFVRSELLPSLRRILWESRLRRTMFLCLLLTVIAIQMAASTSLFSDRTYFRAEQYAFATDWLKQHAEPGDVVFHNIYDFSMVLFYLDDEQNYIVGLDPTFMYDPFPETYRTWADISGGRRSVDEIVSTFHARHVIVDTRLNAATRTAIISHLDASPFFTLIGQREGIYLYTCTAACNALWTSPSSSQFTTNPSPSAKTVEF